MDSRRDQIIDILRREFVGPDPLPVREKCQPNGEEILTGDPPHIRYIAGVLCPQQVVEEDFTSQDSDTPPVETENEDVTDLGQSKSTGNQSESLEDAEELLNLSNAYMPSAFSMTVAIYDGDTVHVEVNAGVYAPHKFLDPKSEKESSHWHRSPIRWDNDKKPLPLPPIGTRKLVVCPDLSFHCTKRYLQEGCSVYTLSLVNDHLKQGKSLHADQCFFQVQFSLRSELGFSALPDVQKIMQDEDFQSNQLLYRDAKIYAQGHGCSTGWREKDGSVHEIHTEIFPEHEIKPIVPTTIAGVSLEMLKMSDYGNHEETLEELDRLCGRYREWIDGLKQQVAGLSDQDTAWRHIEACEDCLDRMQEGVRLLGSDTKIRIAFQYMNRAMLLQQIHYNMPLQRWAADGTGGLRLDEPRALPEILDEKTWPGDWFGKWRPFQLAFILMNLKSILERSCDDRAKVDLIWFPTGGGKTEAYLGLSAYAIFMRRLMDQKDHSTAILMRYTLRLLTAQQYERASALICACETIRRERADELGDSRISIGLWAGRSATPNKRADAIAAYNKLKNGKSDENPFLMLKCPWCGAQMGLVEKPGARKGSTLYDLLGYRKKGNRFAFQCHNAICTFSKDDCELPLLVIDEDIYDSPPTLLLGTVDKFAMLPFRPEAQGIFGLRNGERFSSPDLIIQDELHLISGPLGSMVGHYETLIHELCIDRRGNKPIYPKIISSTATISRAKEQCHALYACGQENVKQFPPAGLSAGDSFFAQESKELDGRKYVGIMAPTSTSMATTMIRLYASLLYAAKAIDVDNESERDPYWTNIGYFNSIRELGQMETWIKQDVDEYLHVIYKRRQEDLIAGYKQNRRYINREEELTSRIRSDKIPASLQSLAIEYPKVGDENPVDVCLSTNMFSVGVDVSRLGLMCVAGQPKTTSEYIQATSRVGRSKGKPGLVFTAFSPGKPRDKSHYEQFRGYHSKIYCHVEPTSVTPFSPPLRDRALHAVLIGLLRLFGDENFNSRPRLPKDDALSRAISVIGQRVQEVESEELDATLRQLDAIMSSWKHWEPAKFQDFSGGDELPLMYMAGMMPNELWDERGFATPTSMRNVDASCEAKVLPNGYEDEV